MAFWPEAFALRSDDMKTFKPARHVVLPALVAAAALAGCSIVPSDRGVPVRTAQAQINATTVDQPLASHPVTGIVRFAEMKDGGVRVSGEVKNLKPNSEVGFHIHQNGDCTGDGTAAGGHFNPGGMMHGTPGHGHAGDLPMLKADALGTATIQYVSHEIKLAGPDGIMGRGVIVHRDPDDYKTQPTGNAGPRLACGVVMTGS